VAEGRRSLPTIPGRGENEKEVNFIAGGFHIDLWGLVAFSGLFG
jgi:hypothetical protein